MPNQPPHSKPSSSEKTAATKAGTLAFNAHPVAGAQTQLPADHALALKVMPRPADVNSNGDIFGGWVMSNVDMAGSVLAMRQAQGRVATVAVNQFVFKHPVRVGDIVNLLAKVERIGRTSITINVAVYAERMERQGCYIKVTEATLTYVAIDGDGRPRPVPNRELSPPQV
jgi:acyl-CoA thioesterase YciA